MSGYTSYFGNMVGDLTLGIFGVPFLKVSNLEPNFGAAYLMAVCELPLSHLHGAFYGHVVEVVAGSRAGNARPAGGYQI